jgi:hypothetical protein
VDGQVKEAMEQIDNGEKAYIQPDLTCCCSMLLLLLAA